MSGSNRPPSYFDSVVYADAIQRQPNSLALQQATTEIYTRESAKAYFMNHRARGMLARYLAPISKEHRDAKSKHKYGGIDEHTWKIHQDFYNAWMNAETLTNTKEKGGAVNKKYEDAVWDSLRRGLQYRENKLRLSYFTQQIAKRWNGNAYIHWPIE